MTDTRPGRAASPAPFFVKGGQGRVKKASSVLLTEGSVPRGLLSFAAPLFLGQLLQQAYNLADAWVVGNFSTNDAFAAVTSAGNLIFLILGFFNGFAIGGGVIISKYFGAGDREKVSRAVHNHVLIGLAASLAATLVGVLLTPRILVWMNTPASVLPHALSYVRIYFAGVTTVVMYNICMSVMRSLGDSLHPLYYLVTASVINIALDLLLVAGLGMGAGGAALATVLSQGISTGLCAVRMFRAEDQSRIRLSLLRPDRKMIREILLQGLPTGVQGSVISIGNLVIQSNINAFGAYAMAGHGAYSKLEGFVFLPITCMSMALPTFISQNLGAGEYERARKGAAFGIGFGMVLAEAVGAVIFLASPYLLKLFIQTPESIVFGRTHARVVTLFYALLAFSHCAAGVLRGCGKAVVPMVTMLAFWCAVRILYVALAIAVRPEFSTISWAYPLTWSLSTVTFAVFLLKSDWTRSFEGSGAKAIKGGKER